MRVLVASHEWEASSPGGAQRSAAALAEGLAAVDGVEVLLASAVRHLPVPPQVGPGRSEAGFDEVLVESETDNESFSWVKPAHAQNWARVLTDFRPDVVHLHHYLHIGIELPQLIRRLLPSAAIVMTLHEYLAICLRSGLMIDGLDNLCLSSSVTKCAQCVHWPVEQAFAREDYVRRGLGDVDVFVTPSEFARRRYLDWDLGPVAVRCVDNVVTLERSSRVDRGQVDDGGLRLAFIGQHTPYKGLSVLLDALSLVERLDSSAVDRVDVYGGGSERFGAEFDSDIRSRLERGAPLVRAHGRYGQDDLPGILDSVDAIVVPSIWWENSPVVIEEALARRVPVICSDIGGMAEKVRDGVDGWHFQAGNAAALADLLLDLAGRDRLQLPDMRRPAETDEVVRRHLEVYAEAIGMPKP